MSPVEVVAELRKGIDKARAEREQIASAPVPLEEASARVDAWIEARQQLAGRFFEPGPHFTSPGGGASGFHLFNFVGQSDASGVQQSIDSIFCFLAPDQTRMKIMESVKAHIAASPIKPVQAMQRTKKLAEVDVRLLRLEVDEELAIRASEETASPVLRRPDARPEIVLASNLEPLEAA